MKSMKALILVAFAVLFSSRADAQLIQVNPDPESPIVWNTFIGQQLAGMMQSPTAEIRHKSLQLVTQLAAYGPDAVDLSETLPPLLSIYRTDPDERCRMAALSGMHAIGDHDTLRRLHQGLYKQSSKRVQLATMATLVAFYGPATFEGDRKAARLAKDLQAHFQRVKEVEAVVAAGH